MKILKMTNQEDRCPNCGRRIGGPSNGDCDCYNHPD